MWDVGSDGTGACDCVDVCCVDGDVVVVADELVVPIDCQMVSTDQAVPHKPHNHAATPQQFAKSTMASTITMSSSS